MAKIRRCLNHGNVRWRLDFGIVAGKRKVQFFQEKADAERELKEHEKSRKELGNIWNHLPVSRKHSICEVLRQIKKHNTTLEEVWQFWQDHSGRKAGIKFSEAISKYMESHKESGSRPSYVETLGVTLRQFAAGREDQDIGTIQRDEIRQFLFGGSDAKWTKQSKRQRLASFFSWAKMAGYIAENPIDRIESVKVDHPEPEIFTVDQSRALIESAKEDPQMLNYFVIALFLGIRPEEIKRLKDNDIDFEKGLVTVGSHAAKTRDRRIVEMIEPVKRLYHRDLGAPWPITNYRRRWLRIRKSAGLGNWPNDVLRHTAASHFYNLYGINRAIEQLGHSANTMLKHYRQLVSKEDTKEWMEI